MKKLLLIVACVLSVVNVPAFSQERFIGIDGTQIRINTIGIENRQEGLPVVVFESGLGTPMGNWDRVLGGVSKQAPLLAYDRPGIGKSPENEESPTIKNVADLLLKILNELELEPPYILVGHSLGGVYVRGFAVHYPEKLAGLVIVDPGDFTETQVNKREYYDVLGWDDRRIDQELTKIEETFEKRREKMSPAIQRESLVLTDLRANDFQEIRENPLPNVPVHILMGGRFDMPIEMRSKEFDNEALFRSKMEHRMIRWTKVIQSVDKGMLMYSGDAGHFVYYDDPDLLFSSVRIVLQDYYLLKEKKQKQLGVLQKEIFIQLSDELAISTFLGISQESNVVIPEMEN